MFPGLHELDVCFGQDATVDLLQAVKSLLVVSAQKASVAHGQHGLLVTGDAHGNEAFMGYPLPFGLRRFCGGVEPEDDQWLGRVEIEKGRKYICLADRSLALGDSGESGLLPLMSSVVVLVSTRYPCETSTRDPTEHFGWITFARQCHRTQKVFSHAGREDRLAVIRDGLRGLET